VLDQWTHVAFTWNGEANGVHTQLYLDGVQTANPTRFNGSGSPISDEGNLFTIGNRPDGNTSYFKGKLDDFRIWNRTLSAADVANLFSLENDPSTDNDNNGTNPPVDENASDPNPYPPAGQIHVPIVRTESVRQSEDVPPRFAGTVLTDGGSSILESGFIVSEDVFLYPNFHLIAQPGESPQAFTATPQDGQLEPGKLYYYRAYAVNAAGGNYGSLKKFRVPEQSDAWWARMPAVGGGWRDSEWFGTFRRHANTEWIYHAQLGWVYALSDQEDGLWLWSKEDGWLWTKPGVLPHLWKHRTGNWLYLMGSRDGKPVFHDYATGLAR